MAFNPLTIADVAQNPTTDMLFQFIFGGGQQGYYPKQSVYQQAAKKSSAQQLSAPISAPINAPTASIPSVQVSAPYLGANGAVWGVGSLNLGANVKAPPVNLTPPSIPIALTPAPEIKPFISINPNATIPQPPPINLTPPAVNVTAPPVKWGGSWFGNAAFSAPVVPAIPWTSPNITPPTVNIATPSGPSLPSVVAPNIAAPNITPPTMPAVTPPSVSISVTPPTAPNITPPSIPIAITPPNITAPNITPPSISAPNISAPSIPGTSGIDLTKFNPGIDINLNPNLKLTTPLDKIDLSKFRLPSGAIDTGKLFGEYGDWGETSKQIGGAIGLENGNLVFKPTNEQIVGIGKAIADVVGRAPNEVISSIGNMAGKVLGTAGDVLGAISSLTSAIMPWMGVYEMGKSAVEIGDKIGTWLGKEIFPKAGKWLGEAGAQMFDVVGRQSINAIIDDNNKVIFSPLKLAGTTALQAEVPKIYNKVASAIQSYLPSADWLNNSPARDQVIKELNFTDQVKPQDKETAGETIRKIIQNPTVTTELTDLANLKGKISDDQFYAYSKKALEKTSALEPLVAPNLKTASDVFRGKDWENFIKREPIESGTIAYKGQIVPEWINANKSLSAEEKQYLIKNGLNSDGYWLKTHNISLDGNGITKYKEVMPTPQSVLSDLTKQYDKKKAEAGTIEQSKQTLMDFNSNYERNYSIDSLAKSGQIKGNFTDESQLKTAAGAIYDLQNKKNFNYAAPSGPVSKLYSVKDQLDPEQAFGLFSKTLNDFKQNKPNGQVGESIALTGMDKYVKDYNKSYENNWQQVYAEQAATNPKGINVDEISKKAISLTNQQMTPKQQMVKAFETPTASTPPAPQTVSWLTKTYPAQQVFNKSWK